MKKGFITLAACMICVSLCVSAAAGGAGLYGYPGKVVQGPERKDVDDGEGGDRFRYYRTYYTRDAFEKVVGYYREKSGLRELDKAWDSASFDTGETRFPAVIVLRRKSVLGETDVFDPLEDEAARESAGMTEGGHSMKDVEKARKRYGYLAGFAFFPGFDARGKIAECKQGMSAEIDSAKQDYEDFGKKMSELARQGRFEEMRSLMTARAPGHVSAIRSATAKSHWNDWIACLDELDRHAFRTEIWIGE